MVVRGHRADIPFERLGKKTYPMRRHIPKRTMGRQWYKSLFDVRPHGFEQCRERAAVETFPAHTHYGGAGFGAGR